MSIDPRTPVIVGVGQHNQHSTPADALDPVQLFEIAARLAGDDAGHGLLAKVDTIAAVGIVSWPYTDPAAIVARALGLANARSALSTTGGNSPQLLINEFAQRIAAGTADVVLIGGGESMHARWGARKEPRVDLAWATYDDPVCPDQFGVDTPGTNGWEMAHGMTMPTLVYPLFETALRAALGHTIEEHQAHIGALFSHFSGVAAENQHAWKRTAYTGAEIATATPDNRMVVFPYTKRMCANIDVDQSAAVMMCSYETARAAGVPTDQLVFLHAGADAHDQWWVSERPSLANSVAIGVLARAALGASGIALDDVARFDLYSCFPSAVQFAMDSIGLAGPMKGDSRPLTVTGGLAFAGGPVNNYVTHGVAQMVSRCREDAGSYGYTTALGWYATKHSSAVWSTTPPANGFTRVDPSVTQAEVDAVPHVVAAEAFTGSIVVEATSVAVERDGTPTLAILAGRNAAGERVIANSSDRDAMSAMMTQPWEGTTVQIENDGPRNVVVG